MAISLSTSIVSGKPATDASGLGVLFVFPKAMLGMIPIQGWIDETHNQALRVTDNPVQLGTPITDHSYLMPAELSLECVWSNSSNEALVQVVQEFFSGGAAAVNDYVGSVYSRLRALQEKRQPFDVMTSLRSYQNMMITALQIKRDNKTSRALMTRATLREVIFATTTDAQLVPVANQKNASSTQATTNLGTQSAVSGTPSPGGAVPPQ